MEAKGREGGRQRGREAGKERGREARRGGMDHYLHDAIEKLLIKFLIMIVLSGGYTMYNCSVKAIKRIMANKRKRLTYIVCWPLGL